MVNETIERGLQKTSRAVMTFVASLMDALEAEKSALRDHEVMRDEMVSAAHVEQFALRVFMSADNEDRDGNATK